MQKLISLVLIVALATSASAGYYGGVVSPLGLGMGLGYGIGYGGYGLGMGMGFGLGGLGLGMGMGYGLGMGVSPFYNPLMFSGLGVMGGKYYS